MIISAVAGFVAYLDGAVFFQDDVLRIINLDLELETRLWMGAVCFTVVAFGVVAPFIAWWLEGRTKSGFLTGVFFGIAALAIFSAVLIARDTETYLAEGMDLRLIPLGVAGVVAVIAGIAALLRSQNDKTALARPADPSGIPVSRSEIPELTVKEMSALRDEQRFILNVLADRGLIDGNVDELDRKPLGALD